MHFMPILHKHCRSNTNFYVFSFIIFLAVLMEKFKKIHYLNYVRRGIGSHPLVIIKFESH